MLREDILVSLCVHDIAPSSESAREQAQQFVDLLAGRFRYWEILIGFPAEPLPGWEIMVQTIPNVRLLRLRPGLGPYSRRAALAAEAIGDVVCLASTEEVAFLDPSQMIEDAHRGHCFVLGDRGTASIFDSLLATGGNLSGFRVSARYMQTMAVPRDLLTRLLRHPEHQLALRYPPRDAAIAVALKPAQTGFHKNVRRGTVAARMLLAQRLMVSSAPNVLTALSLASAIVAIGSLAFLFYVVGTWILLDILQPGWVTTSGILGISGIFLGLLGLGLSTGMQKIIDLVGLQAGDDVIEEVGTVNVYDGIGNDLNVYYELGRQGSGSGQLEPRNVRH
jgi:hypothetical protein